MTIHQAKDGAGREPAFPEGVSFLELAGLPNTGWALYRFEASGINEEWKPAEPVDDELKSLLYSGERYPPALALARNDTVRRFENGTPSQRAFAKTYADSLRLRLTQQGTAAFVLARSLRDYEIDLSQGEWYWVLNIKGDPPVAYWVSDDYFIYQCPASYFELAEDQVDRLRSMDAT